MRSDEEDVSMLVHGRYSAASRVWRNGADFDEVHVEGTSQAKRREASECDPQYYSLMRAHTSNEKKMSDGG